MKFKLSGWRVSPTTLALGVYGLFGYHFLLFVGLQNAPAAQANLVNYLWPVLIVVLTPLLLRGSGLNVWHLLAVSLGFSGAAIAILGNADSGYFSLSDSLFGYAAAFGAAIVWSTYSVLTKRAQFETSAIGLFALVAGSLALVAHFIFEPRAIISAEDWLLILLLGVGPLGGAFYLWDAAIKLGDTRRIGILAFLTPLISTALLLVVQNQALSLSIGIAAALIFGAAILGARASRLSRTRELPAAVSEEPEGQNV
jgi:drug/metabolite transporter (DMT)-like permease